MKTVKTTKITGGADYAKVSDRIKEFRHDCPNASITTTPTILDTGMVMFKAYIVKDKTDEHSADSTGHALQTKTGTKDFEKLETVAVGRALALLGYGVDGEIASSEEMEEFNEYKKQQKEEAIMLAVEILDGCKSLDELKTAWASLGNITLEKEVLAKKDELKVKLTTNETA